MYEINCNSIDPNSGDAVAVSFSFTNGIADDGIEVQVVDGTKEPLYFGVDELWLIVDTLKRERDRRANEE